MVETTLNKELPLSEILPKFYADHHLEADGGQQQGYVKVELFGNVHFYFPNTKSRKQIVLKHDIHHIITGYKSDVIGETEIGPWEIASGCARYWAAWALNFYAMAWGIFFNPVGVFRAFVRGRTSKNLYGNDVTDEEALAMTPSELQNMLEIPALGKPLQPGFNDIVSFLFWLGTAWLVTLLSAVLLPFGIVYNLWVFLHKLHRD